MKFALKNKTAVGIGSIGVFNYYGYRNLLRVTEVVEGS